MGPDRFRGNAYIMGLQTVEFYGIVVAAAAGIRLVSYLIVRKRKSTHAPALAR